MSFDQYYGIFALFSETTFINIFYAGVMLGFNLMITNIILSEIFSLFILDISNCFGPVCTIYFFKILGLEDITSTFTMLSFGLYVPGMILLLSG